MTSSDHPPVVDGAGVAKAMLDNVQAARTIAQARTADYAAGLWADVRIRHGSDEPHATFSEIVRAVIVGRGSALAPARGDVRALGLAVSDTFAVHMLTAWFLDFGYVRFGLAQGPVARLFGPDPVVVSEDEGTRLAVSAAQFLCGYYEEDATKRAVAAPLAALTIKEAMWGSPLPEEWI